MKPAQAQQTTLWREVCLSAVVLSFAAILVSAPPANAARTYDSQISGFKESVGVTMDTGNHVWISDPGKHGLISEYSAYPSQELLATRTGNGKFIRHGASVARLAVNASNNHLYVADSTHIDNFNALGYFVSPEWHLCPFGECGASVATDNSEGPSRGRVYAAVALSNEPYADGYVAAYDPNHFEVPFEASEEYLSGNRITGTPVGGPFHYNFENEGGPRSMVVDPSGDLFIADSGTNEVYEFESSGEFIRTITGAEAPEGFGEVLGVAVDPTNEDVLVVDRIRGVVDEFSSSGAYLGQITGTGPSQSTPFGELRGGIAVNSDGYLYLADSFHGVVDIFAPKAVLPKVAAGKVTNPTSTSEVLKATVDPNGGSPVTGCQLEYGTDRTYSLGPVACSPDPASSQFTQPTEVTASAVGLTGETTYHYRFAVSNADGASHGPDRTFSPHWVPNLTTEPATAVKATSATLNGSFIGNGGEAEYFFQYGTATNYEHSTPINQTGPVAGTTPTPVVPVAVSGLQELTTYHYRIVATNSLGTTYGNDETFTTATHPTIDGLTSSNVTATAADLQAEINPHGAETAYHFEYGPTTGYGSSAPLPPQALNPGTEAQAVEVHLEGLTKGAVYHFRVVAENEYGRVISEDQSFDFYPPDCPNAHLRQITGSAYVPDCRAYELVSPGDAGGTTLYVAGPNSPEATDPARLAFAGAFGTIPGAGDAMNRMGDVYVATRTFEGWVTRYTGIPANQSSAAGGPPYEHNTGYIFTEATGLRTDIGMDRIIDWNNRGESEEVWAGPQFPPEWNPLVWSSSGAFVEEWPNVKEHEPGPILNQSPDFSHYFFTSEGAAYDNDTVDHTLTPFGREAGGNQLPVGAIPQTSTDGTHALLSTGGCGDRAISSCAPGKLYMSVADVVTFAVSENQLTHELAEVTYAGMTANAAGVYFTSGEQLTTEDHDTSIDLYKWTETGAGEGKPLILVSKGSEGAGNSDSCEATWTSECGVSIISNSHYNADQITRAPIYGNGLSDNPIASANGDIYFFSPEQLDGSAKGVQNQENLYLFRNGRVQFVTSMIPKTFCEPTSRSPECSTEPVLRIQVSPTDSHMAFLTASQVTSYENLEYAEMYTYDPATGVIVCVSCTRNGQPPTSNVWASADGTFMSNDGRAFFSTSDALVPPDTDGVRDVYEYVDGRAQLISSGTSAKDEAPGIAIGIREDLFKAGLVGVSDDGANVYFSTFDTLVGQDTNGQVLKFYDARTNGGFPYVAPTPPCPSADECVGPGSAPPAAPREASGADLGNGGNRAQPRRSRHHRHKGRPHKARGRRRQGGVKHG